MSSETPAVIPVFDPENVVGSLNRMQATLPVPDREIFRSSVLGEYASRLKGDGFEYGSTRPYQPGDNRRYIDAKATARQPDGAPQIRERLQEITPKLWIVTDILQRRNAQNPGFYSEQNLALSAITGLMYMAQLGNMPSAVIAGGDDELELVQRRTGRGKRHIVRTAQQLANAALSEQDRDDEEPQQHLADILGYAGKRLSHSVVAVVSDFRDVADSDDPEHGWRKPFEQLARRNHIIAVELTNPDDQELPEEPSRLTGLGSKIHWIGSGRRAQRIRDGYATDAIEQQGNIDNALASARAHHVQLSTTDGQWPTSLHKQLRSPRRRAA